MKAYDILAGGMTDVRQEFWTTYCRQLADLISLKDWRVVIDRCPCQSDADASVTRVDGRKLITIQLHEAWEGYDLERQRHTLVHELLHAHLWPIKAAGTDLDDVLDEGNYTQFGRRHNSAIEFAVDGIADGLALLLPLPEAD